MRRCVTTQNRMEEMMEEDDTILHHLNLLAVRIKLLNGGIMALSGQEAKAIDEACNKIMERVVEIKTKEVHKL
jgi:hypothetical protein